MKIFSLIFSAFILSLFYQCCPIVPIDHGNPPHKEDSLKVISLYDFPFIGTVDLEPSKRKPTGIVSIRDTTPDIEFSYLRSFIYKADKYFDNPKLKLSLGDTVYFKIMEANGMLFADSIFKVGSAEADSIYKKNRNKIKITIPNTKIMQRLANFGTIDLGRTNKHHLNERDNFHTKVHLGTPLTDAPTYPDTIVGNTKYTPFILIFDSKPIEGNPYYLPSNQFLDFKAANDSSKIYYIVWSSFGRYKKIDEISLTHNHSGH